MFPPEPWGRQPRRAPYYDVAQVCLAGHMINDNYRDHPEHNKDFCPECGKKTITECPACSVPIQGSYEVPGVAVIGSGREHGPAFCHACGEAYPWTRDAVEGARLLADELDMLTPEERHQLAEAIPDLVAEGPRTTAAAVRFKKLVTKAGHEVPALMKELLVAVAAEAARRVIWPT